MKTRKPSDDCDEVCSDDGAQITEVVSRSRDMKRLAYWAAKDVATGKEALKCLELGTVPIILYIYFYEEIAR